jgi:hypothetical protein
LQYMAKQVTHSFNQSDPSITTILELYPFTFTSRNASKKKYTDAESDPIGH